jgi:Domain of unknown function (DUF382)
MRKDFQMLSTCLSSWISTTLALKLSPTYLLASNFLLRNLQYVFLYIHVFFVAVNVGVYLQQGKHNVTSNKGEIIYADDGMASEGDSDEEDKPLSKKKARKMARLTVAELKQLVKKPEVVEWTDVTAADPRILLHLKSYRNTVPIPIHWSAKRDYLQGKRGIEKPPFQLPAYIADTGIATMRDAVKEKEANMSLKAKTRERVQPKMGKVDIDYQKLHDAFFKFQTKPPVTGFGEMYVLPDSLHLLMMLLCIFWLHFSLAFLVCPLNRPPV